MSPRRTSPHAPASDHIVDIDVSEEMRGSFLEYAYSVIYARALPDARDGLKPVQRRILYQLAESGLRPDRAHVKSARVVGEVMGRLHPHGDGAIYDALVRMAQAFSLRLPLIDGHGNFGSPDDGPAAMRYTECRPSQAAMAMTDSLAEDVVDFTGNYDGRDVEPVVLPAAIPNLLVNGAAGIAVGMATNLPPHNLGEVIAAARHLIDHPAATLDDLLRFVPGPDLPTGGRIVGLDGIREAYATGRGSFRIQATTTIEQVSPRRRAIVVTELPFNVGPEKVLERIKDLHQNKKIQGIADMTDLSDGQRGTRLVIEIKSGFHPEAVLAELFRLTPLEDSFAVNNVALVDGQPRTLGLLELLQVFVDHRLEVVRRRSEYRRRKAGERLHLVEGLLVAILDIDEVIALIRSSDDTASARERLMSVFDLSEIQASYILEMPLRRLTKFSRLELETERDELSRAMQALTDIIDHPTALRTLVSTELAEVSRNFATPRRTVLLEADGVAQPTRSVPMEVSDDPCLVLLSSTGLVARTTTLEVPPSDGPRAVHDVIAATAVASARGDVGVVTSGGRVIRLSVLELPTLPPTASRPNVSGGAPLGAFIELAPGESVVGLATLLVDAPTTLALGTAQGIVKRVATEPVGNRSSWEVISLRDRDFVVAAIDVVDTDELVLITSDAQLLRFPAKSVRPQGRSAAGMAGIRLDQDASVLHFGAIDPNERGEVVTISGNSSALPGTEPGSAKVTPFAAYPAKGRGTGGVRCHRFLRGEDVLLLAWVGTGGAHGPAAASATGKPVELPRPDARRDGSGTSLPSPVAGVGGSIRVLPGVGG
ncbi:MAG: DNA topoisomerase IV subunit A [Actinomycetes bacterium]